MIPFNDLALTEGTLFELYKSKGYSDTRLSLNLALEEITRAIEATKGEWTRKRLIEVKKVIKEQIQESYKPMLPMMQEESGAVAGVVYSAYTLDVTTKGIPTSVLDQITKRTADIQGYGFQELYKVTADNHERALRVSLATEVSKGSSLQNTIKAMKDKHDYLTLKNLNTVVGSTIKEAREQATYSAYKDLEKYGAIEGYLSVGVLDSRTSEICRNLDGAVFKMNIDDVPNKPPRHFGQCRSKLTPITKDHTELGTRPSKDGLIPNMNYGEWFSTKSTAFQKQVLGKKKFEAYKRGTYKIGALPDVKYAGQNLSIEAVFKGLNL